MSEFTFDPNAGFPKAAPLLLYEDVDLRRRLAVAGFFGFHELVRVVCVGNWIAPCGDRVRGRDRAARRRTRRLLPRKDYRKAIIGRPRVRLRAHDGERGSTATSIGPKAEGGDKSSMSRRTRSRDFRQ